MDGFHHSLLKFQSEAAAVPRDVLVSRQVAVTVSPAAAGLIVPLGEGVPQRRLLILGHYFAVSLAL